MGMLARARHRALDALPFAAFIVPQGNRGPSPAGDPLQ